MDAGTIEEGGIDAGSSALNEAAATDGEALAYGIATVQQAPLIGPGGPDGILLDTFHDNHVLRKGEEMPAKILTAQALLPDAPEHPVEVAAYPR